MKHENPPIILASEQYKEKYNLKNLSKQNDFYKNMFNTSEERIASNSPAGKCPHHPAHPNTCVWNNIDEASTNCEAMNSCKGIYQFSVGDNQFYAGLGEKDIYYYELK
tara:strand:+ start:1003 stop:1326 length:324 start_codon:yes stop_codon:yes gene_type:complete